MKAFVVLCPGKPGRSVIFSDGRLNKITKTVSFSVNCRGISIFESRYASPFISQSGGEECRNSMVVLPLPLR